MFAGLLGQAGDLGGALITRGRIVAGRLRSSEVRAWAKHHGIAVSARGPIPVSVTEQYQAATGN
jgi:hypothetical protein